MQGPKAEWPPSTSSGSPSGKPALSGAGQGTNGHVALQWELSLPHKVLSGLGPSSAPGEGKQGDISAAEVSVSTQSCCLYLTCFSTNLRVQGWHYTFIFRSFHPNTIRLQQQTSFLLQIDSRMCFIVGQFRNGGKQQGAAAVHSKGPF